MASFPSPAWPTTLMPGSVPRITAKPARTSRWSSTMSTEISPGGGYPGRSRGRARVYGPSVRAVGSGARAMGQAGDEVPAARPLGPALKVPAHCATRSRIPAGRGRRRHRSRPDGRPGCGAVDHPDLDPVVVAADHDAIGAPGACFMALVMPSWTMR